MGVLLWLNIGRFLRAIYFHREMILYSTVVFCVVWINWDKTHSPSKWVKNSLASNYFSKNWWCIPFEMWVYIMMFTFQDKMMFLFTIKDQTEFDAWTNLSFFPALSHSVHLHDTWIPGVWSICTYVAWFNLDESGNMTILNRIISVSWSDSESTNISSTQCIYIYTSNVQLKLDWGNILFFMCHVKRIECQQERPRRNLAKPT